MIDRLTVILILLALGAAFVIVSAAAVLKCT